MKERNELVGSLKEDRGKGKGVRAEKKDKMRSVISERQSAL